MWASSRQAQTAPRPVTRDGSPPPTATDIATRSRRTVMIFRSPYPDIAIPDVALTPFVLRHADRLADKPALIDGLTGHGLPTANWPTARADGGVGARGTQGFGKGDVFAIFAPNSPEYAVAFHAVASLGGIVTTVNPPRPSRNCAYQLIDAGATYLLTVPERLDERCASRRLGAVREVFVFGDVQGHTSFASLLQRRRRPTRRRDRSERTIVAALPYSSGTTGLPKGVMLTHRNLVANVAQSRGVRPISRARHADRCHPVLSHLRSDRHHELRTRRRRHAGHHAPVRARALPADRRMYRRDRAPPRAADRPGAGEHPVSTTTTSRGSGSSCAARRRWSETVDQACRERLGCRVKQGLRPDRGEPVTHMVPADPPRTRLGIGRPAGPNTECKDRRPRDRRRARSRTAGRDLDPRPAGDEGLPQPAGGHAQTIDAEGWLHTGDLGFADEDG